MNENLLLIIIIERDGQKNYYSVIKPSPQLIDGRRRNRRGELFINVIKVLYYCWSFFDEAEGAEGRAFGPEFYYL